MKKIMLIFVLIFALTAGVSNQVSANLPDCENTELMVFTDNVQFQMIDISLPITVINIGYDYEIEIIAIPLNLQNNSLFNQSFVSQTMLLEMESLKTKIKTNRRIFSFFWKHRCRDIK